MPIDQGDLRGYGIPIPSGGGRVSSIQPRPLRVPQYQRQARANRATTGTVPAQPFTGTEKNFTRRQKTVPVYQTSNPRDIMALVQLYAKGRRTVVLRYRKRTTGGFVVREIEPYSIRIRNTARGMVRYLYGVCSKHGTIHSFIIDNIKGATGTNRSYSPRWTVEL